MAIHAGQDVGSYHIIEALGQGGMATVYKAYDMRLKREVAIKFIRVDVIGSAHLEQMLKRFEREAQALAKFMHPNIVPVYDFGEHEGSPYLVMGYLPGGTLKAMTGKPMSYDRAARLLAPVARALEYAHEKNVIHRDVKPGNILLTEKGIPMLSDFGIAKMLGGEETTQLTGTGVGVGTPEYMAPEQWQGKVSPQTDIYALGVVFYELVTGRKPYTADTPAGVLLKQATEPLPRPRIFVPDLPEAVERVLFKALAKNAENRYASMVEFAGVLERLVIQPSPLTSPAIPLPKMGEGNRLPSPAVGGRAGDGGRLPSPTSGGRVGDGGGHAPVVVQPPTATQSPSVVQAPPTRMETRSSGGANLAWIWVGIGILALCLLGTVGAGIITQGFGLLKTNSTVAFTDTSQPIPTLAVTETMTATVEAIPTSIPAETMTATVEATPTLTPTETPTLEGTTQFPTPQPTWTTGPTSKTTSQPTSTKGPTSKPISQPTWTPRP